MTIRETRRAVFVVLAILLVIDAVAIPVLLSPMAKSRAAREADLRQAQTQFKEREREVGPSRGMEQKIAASTGDIANFYQQRLPSQYSQVDAAIGKAAEESGVQLLNVYFKPDSKNKKAVEDLERVDITLAISGPYVNEVKFINSLERDHVFFVINSVNLAGSTNGVQLQVNAETYFKTGAAKVKAGTENKKKTWIAIALFAAASLVIIYQLMPSPSSTPAPATNASTPRGKAQGTTPLFSRLDPSLRTDLLKGSEEVTYHGSGRDIFHLQAEPAPETAMKAQDPRILQQEHHGPPPNPPIPLKFYGFASENNKKKIFLSQGEDVFIAKEGDIVKGRYKVLHVNPSTVEIQDVLSNYSQQIPLSLPNS
jgi:Tfp pilus assembly protein PilO